MKFISKIKLDLKDIALIMPDGIPVDITKDQMKSSRYFRMAVDSGQILPWDGTPITKETGMAIITINGARIQVARKPSAKAATPAKVETTIPAVDSIPEIVDRVVRTIPENLIRMKKTDIVAFMVDNSIAFDPDASRADYIRTVTAWAKKA